MLKLLLQSFVAVYHWSQYSFWEILRDLSVMVIMLIFSKKANWLLYSFLRRWTTWQMTNLRIPIIVQVTYEKLKNRCYSRFSSLLLVWMFDLLLASKKRSDCIFNIPNTISLHINRSKSTQKNHYIF